MWESRIKPTQCPGRRRCRYRHWELRPGILVGLNSPMAAFSMTTISLSFSSVYQTAREIPVDLSWTGWMSLSSTTFPTRTHLSASFFSWRILDSRKVPTHMTNTFPPVFFSRLTTDQGRTHHPSTLPTLPTTCDSYHSHSSVGHPDTPRERHLFFFHFLPGSIATRILGLKNQSSGLDTRK